MEKRFSPLVSTHDPLPGFEEANPGMIRRIDEWAEERVRLNRTRQALEKTYQSEPASQLEQLAIEMRAEWVQIQTVFETITVQRLTLIVYQGDFALVYEKMRVLTSSNY